MLEKRKLTPSPGSAKAIEIGCTCPVIDNNYGRGLLDNGKGPFWINVMCVIHGKEMPATRTCKSCSTIRATFKSGIRMLYSEDGKPAKDPCDDCKAWFKK